MYNIKNAHFFSTYSLPLLKYSSQQEARAQTPWCRRNQNERLANLSLSQQQTF
jgi:hypothetical protein